MIYTFSDFELDRARFELRRHGQPIEVQPKVLRLLLLLVAERARSISDAELMSTLWPGETVTSASVKRAIMGARIALGDRGQGGIRTVRGFGYQFALPVREQTAADSPPSARTYEAPLVGREGILHELDESLEQTMRGRGHAVLLLGSAGMGKTRILEALAERATARGMRVALGACMEFEGAPAFWPLQQVLAGLLEGRDDHAVRTLLGPAASDIAEGFPELRDSLCDPPAAPSISSLPARFRLFDSVTQLLKKVARETPTLLLLDDLHKADQPTLRLLSFLTGQLAQSRLLLVGTARHADAHDRPAQERLAEMARASATRVLVLHGFTRDDIARYLELRTGARASEPVLARIEEQTAGNPLFLEEVVRSVRSRKQPDGLLRLERVELEELAQSQGLRSAIDRHLGMLSTATRELLRGACIVGREFALDLLAELQEAPAERVLCELTEAVSTGVVQELPQRVGCYRFTHALLRDALYGSLSPAERSARHARVGHVLEARGAAHGDDAELAQMAEHFRLGAHAQALDKALFYAERAATRAMQRLAYEDAAEHFRRALELAEAGRLDGALRMRLLLARGEALAYGPDPASARAPLLQAAGIARGLGQVDVRAQVARLLACTRESGAVDTTYIDLLREVLAALPDDDSRTPGIRALLAKALSFTDEHDERAELALSALALANNLHEPVLRGEALQACHEALTAPEHLRQRASIAEQLARLGRRHAAPRAMLYALTAQFQNGVERGDVGELEQALAELEGLERRVRDPSMRWYAHTYRSTCAMIAGRFALAEEHAREALQLGGCLGDALAFHQYCVQVTGIYRLQGRDQEAEDLTRAVCARFPALGGWRCFLGCIQADAGRAELARSIFHELMDDRLTVLRRDPYLLSALCPMTELCVRVGNARAAKVLYDALVPYEAHHGNVSFGVATYGPISLQLARLATQQGLVQSALQHGERAVREAERMGSPTFTALTSLTLAYALKKQGGAEARREGHALAERATEIALQSGMTPVATQGERLARALG